MPHTRPRARPPSLALAVVLLVPSLGAAQTPAGAPNPVRWSLEAAAAGGDTVVARLTASIHRDWYLYAPTQPPGGPYPLEVAVGDDGGWRAAGELRAPAPRRLPDRNFDLISEVYRGRAAFELPLRPPADGDDAAPPALLVTWQACTRTLCLPPRTDTLRWAAPARPSPEPLRPGRP